MILIINTNDSIEIFNDLKKADFNHFVFIDAKSWFKNINGMQLDERYQTLLLDAENKVIAVGNPVNNPKILNLFKRIILDENVGSNSHGVDYSFNPYSQSLGIVHYADSVESRFMITNRSNVTYHIEELISSCGCVLGSISVDSLRSGESTEAVVMYVADSIMGRFSSYIDIYYREKENPDRLLVYGIKQ